MHASVGRKHAMTRYDDRERVLTERLADVARILWSADARGDVTVRKGAARGNRAGDFVNAALKRGHFVQVELDAGEIRWLTAQQ